MRTAMLLVAAWLLTSGALAGSASDSPNNSKVRFEFQVAPTQFGNLREILTQFAETEGFSVDDYGAKMPPKGGRHVFWLRLVRNQSIEVFVLNIRKETRMFVWAYKLNPDPAFEAMASKLEQVLRDKWPDIAPYIGE